MSAMTSATMLSRTQTLRALGVMPLRLRTRSNVAVAIESFGDESAPSPTSWSRCIALAPMHPELNQHALSALYTKISEAIASLGLQCVRIADAERDAGVRVLAFGDVVVPATIDARRVLRADALSVLHTDRDRKRALWVLLQSLGNETETV